MATELAGTTAPIGTAVIAVGFGYGVVDRLDGGVVVDDLDEATASTRPDEKAIVLVDPQTTTDQLLDVVRGRENVHLVTAGPVAPEGTVLILDPEHPHLEDHGLDPVQPSHVSRRLARRGADPLRTGRGGPGRHGPPRQRGERGASAKRSGVRRGGDDRSPGRADDLRRRRRSPGSRGGRLADGGDQGPQSRRAPRLPGCSRRNRHPRRVAHRHLPGQGAERRVRPQPGPPHPTLARSHHRRSGPPRLRQGHPAVLAGRAGHDRLEAVPIGDL